MINNFSWVDSAPKFNLNELEVQEILNKTVNTQTIPNHISRDSILRTINNISQLRINAESTALYEGFVTYRIYTILNLNLILNHLVKKLGLHTRIVFPEKKHWEYSLDGIKVRLVNDMMTVTDYNTHVTDLI